MNKVLRLQRQYRAEARSWASDLKAGRGELAMIRAPYRRTRSPALGAGKAHTGRGRLGLRGAMSADQDFNDSIEARRRMARRHLDDFAPLMIGSGG